MASHEEKKRRKEIRAKLTANEDQQFLSQLPFALSDLGELLDFIDENLNGCDHSYSATKQFLTKRELDPDKCIKWLRENGGFCDCEVLFNITDRYDSVSRRITRSESEA